MMASWMPLFPIETVESSEVAFFVLGRHATYTPDRHVFPLKGDIPLPYKLVSRRIYPHVTPTGPADVPPFPPTPLPQILPLLRRLLREPEAQELTVQLASSLSERAVTRTIRAIFNVKQPIYDGAAPPPPAASAPVPSRR